MPVTLAQAQLNTQDDVDFAVIENLRRYSWLLDQIVFDDVVNPTGGDSYVYGYTRLKTPRTAAFRKFNQEYTSAQAETERITTALKVLGGSYEIDRKLARLGQQATSQEAIQLQQLITAVRMRFVEEMINGDTAVNEDGFDGLDTVLAGSSTEVDATTIGVPDIRPATINTQAAAMAAATAIDLWLSTLVPSQVGGGDAGAPGALPIGQKAILGNTRSIALLKALARWGGIATESKDDLGRNVSTYGDWNLVDIGDNTMGTAPIIPITAGDTDLYAVTFGMDALHGASAAGPLIETWPLDYSTAGVIKKGEVEMGPVALVLKNTKACGVLRDVQVS
jgi:hypothetical protein